MPGVNLKEITNEKISNNMCLYLDWNPSASSITVGLSDGCVSIVSLLESKLEIQEEWKAHDEVLETYKKHDSLAYGEANHIDGKTKPLVATCTFYDKLVRVWRPGNDIVL
uniref:Uncharacterized protein n=1 Tax=Cajanus cajan TaxID=3821 RepID=A0A151QM51_CAJCA|nr:hypothetical protein KK1_048362 [Cajanus cajan]